MPIIGAIQPAGAMPTPKPLQVGAAVKPQTLQANKAEAAKPREIEMRKLRRAVADFESLFLGQLLKSMQSTVTKSKLGTDSGGEVLQEVGWEKVGESLAHQGGIGLGDMLFRALSQRITADTTDADAESKPPTLEDLVGRARFGTHMKPRVPEAGTPDK